MVRFKVGHCIICLYINDSYVKFDPKHDPRIHLVQFEELVRFPGYPLAQPLVTFIVHCRTYLLGYCRDMRKGRHDYRIRGFAADVLCLLSTR